MHPNHWSSSNRAGQGVRSDRARPIFSNVGMAADGSPSWPPHGRDWSTAHHQADQRADARPETAQVDAPPEHAEAHRDRVAVGHADAEDTPRRPQGERAEPEAESGEPSSGRSRGRFPAVQADGPFPAALPRGAEGRGWVAKVCREPCAGHEVLLARHAARLLDGTGLTPWGGHHFGEQDSVPGRGATAGGQTLPPGSGRQAAASRVLNGPQGRCATSGTGAGYGSSGKSQSPASGITAVLP